MAYGADSGGGKKRTPDYEREDRVRLLMERCIDDAKRNTARWSRDRQDLLNLLMERGGSDNQWVVWDASAQNYKPRPTDGEAGLADWIPRATSNDFANRINGICSILNQSSPAKQFRPSTDDDADVAAAQVCEDALPVLEEEISYDRLRRQIHRYITLIDKVAVCYYYDNDEKYGTAPIPAMQCQNPECPDVVSGDGGLYTPMELEENGGACPACGSTDFAEVIDPSTGIPVGVDYPKGKICAEVYSSYEFSIPPSATAIDAAKLPWILTHSQMDPTQAAGWWPKHADIFRDTAGSRQSLTGLQAQYARTMQQLSSPQAANRWGGDQGRIGPIIYRLQHDPIVDKDVNFPEGLYAVMCNETILESGPLPFADSNGTPRKSILLRTYMESPGTPYGKPPGDDLVPLQQNQNLIETLILMILMHTAAPQWAIPETVTMTDLPSGVPGEAVRFRSHDGQRPTLERGANPPEGLYKLLEYYKGKFDELSGLNAVLQGATPSGDPTLGQIQIQQERGMANFKTPLDNLIEFEKDQAHLLLDIARTSAWSPRFRQVMGENRQWEVTQFSAADLNGRVDIVIDPVSAWPRSGLMDRLSMREAAQMGVLMPQQDPEVATKILARMDLAELKPSFDVDAKQIARVLDTWKAATDPREILPVNPEVDNLKWHLFHKQNFMKTEDAEGIRDANPALYQAMLAHIKQIQQFLQPPAPPAPPPGPPAERGDGSAVEAAVASGAIVPEGAQPPPPVAPDPLDAAMAAGVMRPEPEMSEGMPGAAQAMPAGPPSTGVSIDAMTESWMDAPITEDVTRGPSPMAP